MHPLIHDWNRSAEPRPSAVMLDDETLRDGLQSPSVRCPTIDEKLRILHLIDRLGIDTADIGLPGAGPHVVADVERLAREIVDQRLSVKANCAARTVIADIRPIVGDRRSGPGMPIECCTFIGSSPLRQYAEGWTIDQLLKLTEEAIGFAVGEGLPVMYVTEDTTRADPETLRRLYSTAIRAGAKRVCVADTVGHATPVGAAAVVAVHRAGRRGVRRWRRHRLARPPRSRSGDHQLAGRARSRRDQAPRRGDRHRRARRQHADGHAARQPRADGVHRARSRRRWSSTARSCRPSPACPIPPTIRSSAATRSAPPRVCTPQPSSRPSARSDRELVDAVYSGVPAGMVGREQEIEIGPMSGKSNVVFWLEQRGLHGDRRGRRPDLRPGEGVDDRARASGDRRRAPSADDEDRRATRLGSARRLSIAGNAAINTSPTACRTCRDLVERVVLRVPVAARGIGVLEIDDVRPPARRLRGTRVVVLDLAGRVDELRAPSCLPRPRSHRSARRSSSTRAGSAGRGSPIMSTRINARTSLSVPAFRAALHVVAAAVGMVGALPLDARLPRRRGTAARWGDRCGRSLRARASSIRNAALEPPSLAPTNVTFSNSLVS